MRCFDGHGSRISTTLQRDHRPEAQWFFGSLGGSIGPTLEQKVDWAFAWMYDVCHVFS